MASFNSSEFINGSDQPSFIVTDSVKISISEKWTCAQRQRYRKINVEHLVPVKGWRGAKQLFLKRIAKQMFVIQ